MPAALLTTFFFAASVVLARRSVEWVGSQPANLARQAAALVVLGLWAHLAGQGWRGPGLAVFLFSGVVGFGLGDWALFEALPRIGPALTALLCQCLAAPIAAITERLWLGTLMTGGQLASSAVILIGVAVAMAPERGSDIPRGHRVAGTLFAIVAACGQAWGAVISRDGFRLDDGAGVPIDAATAAYQRLLGGIVTIALLVGVTRLTSGWRAPREATTSAAWRRATPWIIGNAIAGPVLGVTCYQWALHVSPSSIVLPIVATTPLLVWAMAFGFEKSRPQPRTIIGSLLAVAGVIALIFVR